MTKRKNGFLQGLIAALIVTAIAGIFGFLIKDKFAVEENDEITSDIVESSLKEVKELTTLKYHYKNVASFESSQQFQGIKLPFTTKSFLYTYEGDINAGVDLDQANASVDENNKIITIKLPDAKILSHDIDEDSIMIFDEKNSVFNPMELEDYTNFRKEEEAKVEKEAVKKGLLKQASQQTDKAIKEILNINPIIAEEYTISIK
ncbi:MULTISPECIES: DUF4230 domain-containing protein [Anaerococcus]|uniref:DUF4230 domain-containing protein n=1 Tax=Anaerococcus nagyae TaxID=1755241 RepID=A0A3E2TI89_9FIRM|nr:MULTISPECIES: DUF4230 domain-containing protein [Anaerococcus]MBP2069566.1 hypothetical protein [Anaerococcus nagyae]MDU2353929.1 DUF4230 domain-containing protein [Anaerococcus sp.]MDU2565418.1 DUF4230 domain-containing protein [Anaerococcus sp.]MDU3211137.1 DUF4230 domain-containing protein [Anaerococcus sp.]RGB76396.1 DUF4230 domain-containing protein [Anaerococcus nagyae]